MKRLLPMLLFLCAANVYGATCESDGSDVGLESVQACNDSQSTHDGDTITLPPGTFVWATGVNITKAVKLQGAGNSQTTITDNLSGQPLIIVNNVPGVPGGGVTQITGIGITKGTSTGHGNLPGGGLIKIFGSNTSGWQIRIDHCVFTNEASCRVINYDSAIGVIDHNVFNDCPYTVYCRADTWNGLTQGDGSWAAPTDFGGIHTLVFEDNFFNNATAINDNTFFDGKLGGRLIVRHNTFYQPLTLDAALITCHGTEARTRSIRHMEVYNNLIVVMGSGTFINQRGGTGIMFNNRVLEAPTGVTVKFQLTTDRCSDPTYWGRASGTNPWDINDTTAGGTNTNPTPFYTGVAAAGTTQTLVFVSPNPGWSDNRWRGYAVTNTTAPPNAPNPSGQATGADLTKGSTIESNDSNSLTLHDAIFNQGNLTFAPGDGFKIYRPKNTHDETGRAGTNAGAIITGNPAVLQATGDAGNAQVSEPWYGWNNQRKLANGSLVSILFNPSASYIRECTGGNGDECHYFNNGSIMPGYPWNSTATATIGASGMGLTGDNAPLVIPNYGDYSGQYPHPLTVALPVFRAAGTKSVGTTGAVTVTAPANVAIGDLEILISGTDVAQTLSITGNGGSTWTAVSGTPVAAHGGTKLYVWYRMRQAGDSDPQVTPSGNFSISTRLAYQTGTFDTTTPIDTEATGTEGVDNSCSFTPGTTTGVNNCLVLVISTSGADVNAGQVPVCTNANLTNLDSPANDNTNSGGGGGYGVTEGALPTAGGVGTFACTYALSSAKAYLSFAIRPSP